MQPPREECEIGRFEVSAFGGPLASNIQLRTDPSAIEYHRRATGTTAGAIGKLEIDLGVPPLVEVTGPRDRQNGRFVANLRRPQSRGSADQ